MKLEGSLNAFPLRELVDMIVYSSVTGVLNIYAADLSGHLYFRDGHLYHVDAGAADEGVDALAMLLERPQANFAFVSDPKIDRETLWGDHEQHLRMAERLAARWAQIRAIVPHLQLIPALLAPIEQVQRSVSPVHLPLLDLIDGRSTLLELARRLSWAPIEVAEAVAHLVEQRQAELRTADVVAAPATAPHAEEKAAGGLFDRMRRQAGAGKRVEPEPQASAQAPSVDDFVLRVLRS